MTLKQQLGLIAWGLFALSAATSLWVPFTGDQYFFAVGAREIAGGARLYLDFWDVKQPGIYWIYLAASYFPLELAQAVRALEIVSWAVTSLLAMRIVAAATAGSSIAVMTPALVGGAVLLAAPSWHLSQVESFAVLPLMYIAHELTGGRLRASYWLSVGVALACLAFLKLLLLAIGGMLVLAGLWQQSRTKPRATYGRLLVASAWVACGFLVTAGILSIPLLMSGSFSEFIRVSFVYPFSVLTADSAAPISRLLGSLLWLLATSFPLAILAAVSLFRSASPGARAVKLILIVWLVAALFVMLIQRNSWWAYHTTLLKPPLLMLGLIVLAQLAARADWWPECPTLKLAGGSLCLLFALAAAPAYSQLQRKLDLAFVFTISYEDQQRYLNALAPGYPAVQRQSQWSRAQRASSLCVIGDPAVLFFAGKQCPVSVATWSGAALSKEMWRRMATEFSLTRPELVYVATSDRQAVEAHAPVLLLWLEANYDFVAPGQGTDRWYRVRSNDLAKP